MLSMTLDFFQGPHKGKAYKLQFGVAKSKKICYIGRSDAKKYTKNGVSLFKDSEVSEHHGKFELSGKNKIYYTDMKSTNGTFINTVKIEPKKEYPITQGAVLRVGLSQCRVNCIN